MGRCIIDLRFLEDMQRNNNNSSSCSRFKQFDLGTLAVLVQQPALYVLLVTNVIFNYFWICQSSLVSFEVTFNRATIPQTQWRGSQALHGTTKKIFP